MPNLDPFSILKSNKDKINLDVMIALRWTPLLLNTKVLDFDNARNFIIDAFKVNLKCCHNDNTVMKELEALLDIINDKIYKKSQLSNYGYKENHIQNTLYLH